MQKLCSIQIENKVPLDISFLITKSQIEDKRRGELDFQMNRISLFTFISSKIADTSLQPLFINESKILQKFLIINIFLQHFGQLEVHVCFYNVHKKSCNNQVTFLNGFLCVS